LPISGKGGGMCYWRRKRITWQAMCDFHHVSCLCAFSAWTSSSSSWNCQMLAAEQPQTWASLVRHGPSTLLGQCHPASQAGRCVGPLAFGHIGQPQHLSPIPHWSANYPLPDLGSKSFLDYMLQLFFTH
jgi:hypothetical protein